MNLGGLSFCFFYADAEMEAAQPALEHVDAVIHFGSLYSFSSYADATAQTLICAKQNKKPVGFLRERVSFPFSIL
jgi:hypothetical protein